MKLKKIFKPLMIIGAVAIMATPIALVSCGEGTSYDKGLLVEKNIKSFDNVSTDNLYNLVSGSTKVASNYIIFAGSTACPHCNTALTGQPTRIDYTKEEPVNSYNGPFATAARVLNGNDVAKTFVFEDFAPGYTIFPGSKQRDNDKNALVFRAFCDYFGADYSIPKIFAVKNGKVESVFSDGGTLNIEKTSDEIVNFFTSYFKN